MKRAAILCLLLAGCASPPPVVTKMEYLRPDVPPALLTCAPEPAVPTSDMQSAAVQYMIRLNGAWQDCSDHLAAVGQALAAPAASAK
jgi:hypothetical protein